MMDKKQQRQVWQRVYHPVDPPPPISRQGLGQSIGRLQQNLRFYEGLGSHSLYGPAFQQLADQTRQQIQMLRQIRGDRT